MNYENFYLFTGMVDKRELFRFITKGLNSGINEKNLAKVIRVKKDNEIVPLTKLIYETK
jgi:hypothetical protein